MVWSQKRKFLEGRLQELSQLGLALPPQYGRIDNQIPEIVVEQAASALECPVVDLPDGRILYIIWLSLVAARPGARLNYYQIELPWPDSNFEPLPSFEERHGEYYELPGGLDYPYDQILNFKFKKSGWRLPADRVEGLLYAVSTTPIPDTFKHGASIPVQVRFFDRDGQALAGATAHLWLDRASHRSQRAQELAADARSVEPSAASNVAIGAQTGPQRPPIRRPSSEKEQCRAF